MQLVILHDEHYRTDPILKSLSLAPSGANTHRFVQLDIIHRARSLTFP